jgi:hypothetical protein
MMEWLTLTRIKSNVLDDEFERNFRLFFANENCKSCPNEMKAEKCSDFDECSAFGREYYAAGYDQFKIALKKELELRKAVEKELELRKAIEKELELRKAVEVIKALLIERMKPDK